MFNVLIEATLGLPISQPEAIVSVTQGDPIILKCIYDTTVDYLFWYIQHPGCPPTVFWRELGSETSNEGHIRNFSAAKNKSAKTFNMKKSVSQLSDSTVYFCAGRDTVRWVNREAKQKHAKGKGCIHSVEFMQFEHWTTAWEISAQP
uniref:Ig-like domain-containing protein n=1 Tax=Anolis carolinensis TaxID=28377 RepID=A0A803T2P4_ANOCA